MAGFRAPRQKRKPETLEGKKLPTLRERQAARRDARQREMQAWRAGRAKLIGKVPEGLDWFVAVSVPGKERKAGDEAKAAGFAVYWPVERVTIGRPGLRADVERPLFPRYLFIAVPEGGKAGSLGEAQWLREVVSDEHGRWLPVRGGAVEALIRAEGLGTFDRTDARREAERKARLKRFKAGAAVNVLKGPFAGFVARIVALRGEKRVRLLISLLGQETALEMALDDIEEAA